MVFQPVQRCSSQWSSPSLLAVSLTSATISTEKEIREDMGEVASKNHFSSKKDKLPSLDTGKELRLFPCILHLCLQSYWLPFNRQYFSIFNKLNLSSGAYVKMYSSVWVGAQDFFFLDCPQVDEMSQRTHLHGPCQWGVGTRTIEPLSTLWSSLCAQGT